MSSILLALTLSGGFVCPPVHCAEIFVGGEYVMCCYDGHALDAVAMCGDDCIRVDLEAEEISWNVYLGSSNVSDD